MQNSIQFEKKKFLENQNYFENKNVYLQVWMSLAL